MTSLDIAKFVSLDTPPHVQRYSANVRWAFALFMLALAVASFVLDWPFGRVGVFQPMMYGLGVVLISYVTDIPFRKLWQKLAMMDVLCLAGAAAWWAWYTRGGPISFSAPSGTFFENIWPFVGLPDWISPASSGIGSILHWLYLLAFSYVGWLIENVFLVTLFVLIVLAGLVGAAIGIASLVLFPAVLVAGGLSVAKATFAPSLSVNRQTVIALSVVVGVLLLAAWGLGTGWGFYATQDFADFAWKLAAIFVFTFTLAAGVWNAPYPNFHSKIASIPMMFIVLFAFVGCGIWTIAYSTSDAKIYPIFNFIGLKQYYRLFSVDIWSTAAHNAVIFIVLGTFFSFVSGFLIAVFMDQKIRLEGVFRTIYLYPFALSFIVTGHVWAWIFSPAYGFERSVRQMGWTSFTFDWISNNDMAIYCVLIAALWQGTGLVMALMIAGLRSVDEEVWKAARVDGIPKWRTYVSIVIPMMRPVLITTFVIVAAGHVRVYDIVVALTDGGPGTATTVPAVYVYKYLFSGSIGQGLAASTVMLLTSAIILIPWVYVEFVKNKPSR